jgi:PHD/YefM family antitoxin component YafN of YafNO toxin-antitoxin module
LCEAGDVNEISISKFKATCLSEMEKVRKTRRPLLVTRFGQPVARILPPEEPKMGSEWLGSLSGEAQLNDDLVAPATDDTWEVLAA